MTGKKKSVVTITTLREVTKEEFAQIGDALDSILGEKIGYTSMSLEIEDVK